MWRNLLVLATFISVVYSYGYYRDAMPNGRRIPCDSSCAGYCEGFGHILNSGADSCSGGGEHPFHYLSKFGNAWQNNGMVWNKEMCKIDSDGDGESNGDEMGDPCCVWKTGSVPSRVSSLSNPTLPGFFTNLTSCTYDGVPTVSLTVDSTTQSKVIMTWNSESCLCGFNISQTIPRIADIQTLLISNPLSGSSQVVVSGLEPGTNYSFSINSFNMAGSSPLSVVVQTLSVSPDAPAAPGGVTLVSATSSSLSLSWPASASSTSYELDVGLESTGVYTTVYSGSALTYVAQGLEGSTNYLVRVRGVNSNGVGFSSSSSIFSTLANGGTSVSASYTSDDGSITVGWSVAGDSITFVMTGQTLGYVAIGWGKNPTMLTTDMVVGSFDKNTGNGSVIDLWSTARDTPVFDSKQDVSYVSGAQNTTHTTITFTRSLTTSDKDQDISIEDKQMYLVWAIGSGLVTTRSSFGLHTKRGAAQVNFFTGSSSQVNTDKLKNAHGALAFFAWGILLPIGSFIARYKKCDMGVWWFRAHVGIQIFGSVLTFISFIIIASALGTSNPHFASTHAICGLIMLILTLGQNFIGAYSHFVYNPNRKKVPVFPDRIHGIFGLATLMFGFITIFLGFDFYNVNLGAWLLGGQCLLFAVTGALVYEFFDGKED